MSKEAECENCGETGTACDVCSTVSCPACREAVRGSASRCIQCNESCLTWELKAPAGPGVATYDRPDARVLPTLPCRPEHH